MITIKEIKNRVIDWKNEKITKEFLKEWAEDLNDRKVVFESNLSERDEFIAHEVLHYLEDIDMNLSTTDDIPSLIEFIEDKSDYKLAYKNWDKYLESIDYKIRKEKLKNDLFYNKYCT